MQGDRTWTYRQFRDESVRMAHFLLRRLGPIDDDAPGPRRDAAREPPRAARRSTAAARYAGLTLFGVNTGLRGDVLAGVLNQSRARLLVVDERFWPEVERVRGELKHVAPENILVLRTGSAATSTRPPTCATASTREVGPAGDVARRAGGRRRRRRRNLMVIYTSGTTGLPKGINNNHMKLLRDRHRRLGATSASAQDDVGYACMPLFHSNAIFVGFMPAFWVGGSMALRERFSASQFVPDVLRYGVTFWNYVGEPVHYVLARDREAVRRRRGAHPRRGHQQPAATSSATPSATAPRRPTSTASCDWLGLEDMFELYGSTEAAISTFRRKGDPRGSVGEITDAARARS